VIYASVSLQPGLFPVENHTIITGTNNPGLSAHVNENHMKPCSFSASWIFAMCAEDVSVLVGVRALTPGHIRFRKLFDISPEVHQITIDIGLEY